MTIDVYGKVVYGKYDSVEKRDCIFEFVMPGISNSSSNFQKIKVFSRNSKDKNWITKITYKLRKLEHYTFFVNPLLI